MQSGYLAIMEDLKLQMAAPHVLLIAGVGADNETLVRVLTRDGHDVHVVFDIDAACGWAEGKQPDLIILHASTMDGDGVDGCRRLRAMLSDTPIIHTRGKGAAKDDTAGADVYLVEPFTARKILNRARDLLPADQFTQEIIRAGDITLYKGKPSVEVGDRGERILTPKQAQLLEVFLRHPNQVVDRKQLMRDVWETDYVGDTRTLDVHIRWVREAIEVDPSKPRHIVTVRGVGYIFHPTGC